MKRNHPAWTLVGAVIGAGFASGREIASFFARWGAWGWLGAAAATAVIGCVAAGAGSGRQPGKLRRALFAALLTVSAGAMLSAAGEIAALSLPFRGAYPVGILATLALAAACGRKNGMAAISRLMTGAVVALMALGCLLPPLSGVRVDPPGGWSGAAAALLSGVCYGGFNAALAVPLLEKPEGRGSRSALWTGCGVILLLLALGLAVFRRHPALLGETLPFVRLSAQMGRTGCCLGAAALYLAVLTTLMVCLAGLRTMLRGGWLLALGASLAGFGGLVDRAYPLLGGACLVCLALEHRQN